MTTAAASASWMALVAATTIGVGSLQRVRAEVSAQIPASSEEARQAYRLIVQSYPKASVARGGLPSEHARPLASAQRAITLEELAKGVSVDVVGLDERDPTADDPRVVVAWVERGKPDLEFDALRARPSDGAMYGVAEADAATEGEAQVVLSKRKG